MGGHLSVFQWGSRAKHRLPERTALERTYDYKGEVLIIGAGAAGLAAARVLEQNQIKYTILEATDRHGGRLKADTAFADFPVDLGAEWIHNLPGILDVLSGVEGTASQTELVPYHLNSAATWNGRRLRRVSRFYLDATFRFFPESKFKRSTWYAFVCRHFADRVQHRIEYNSPVARVDHSRERVEVTTTDGKCFVADKVLVTASIGVLRSGDMAFTPELSQRKKDAITSVGFLPGFKLLLKFSEKFYPDAIEMPTLSRSGEKVFYDMAFQKGSPGCHVLGLLTTGPATEPYYALGSEEEIVAAALAELDAMFGDVPSRAYTGEYRLEDWGRKPFTQGTWVEGFKIRRATLTELNAPLEHKVYFAGEANDVNGQLGVPGALLSGLHAVDQLLTA
jgi:monoamine oxidase